ncbi:hypothetical protein BDL97_02G124200 [Sphagnum fallax]|nr:hypothetical protein BDL97_02G124200 [Sphagnum fallax]
MAARLEPGGHYNLNGGSLVGNALHDLNTVDSRNAEIDGLADVDRDVPTGDDLENDDDSASGGDCGSHSYANIGLQGVDAPNLEQALPMDSDGPRPPYGVLTISDVIPIESTRARFLQLIIDSFIIDHIIPVPESPEMNYNSPNNNDKSKKRKSRDVQYEGDPRYLLPLTFVANLYETLIREVNQRLATVEGLHEKTFGVALEAAGGLYRRLVKKYPKSGGPMTFKRREMASALEARTKFPQLVTGEEKRVRFVVVHGLELVEHPNMRPEDAEWFKRLTGRHDVQIYESDYKYFAARVKHRRAPQHSLSSMPVLSPFPSGEPPNISPSALHQQSFAIAEAGTVHPHPSVGNFQQQQQHTPPHVLQHARHTQPHTPQTLPHVSRDLEATAMHSSIMSAGPPKFCDECGTAYIRESSKFCSECGTKRLGV